MGYHIMSTTRHQEDTMTAPGPGTDAQGRAVIDPTANVLLLVAAETRRQDDLRESENARLRDQVHAQERESALRAAHALELRTAESERLDAIRGVDQAAVQASTLVAETRATVLATQVALSADVVRTQVGAAQTAATEGLTNALAPIQKDISELRQVQYTTAGGKAENVEGATDRRARVSNAGMWIGLAITLTLGLMAAVISVAGIAVAWLLTQ